MKVPIKFITRINEEIKDIIYHNYDQLHHCYFLDRVYNSDISKIKGFFEDFTFTRSHIFEVICKYFNLTEDQCRSISSAIYLTICQIKKVHPEINLKKISNDIITLSISFKKELDNYEGFMDKGSRVLYINSDPNKIRMASIMYLFFLHNLDKEVIFLYTGKEDLDIIYKYESDDFHIYDQGEQCTFNIARYIRDRKIKEREKEETENRIKDIRLSKEFYNDIPLYIQHRFTNDPDLRAVTDYDSSFRRIIQRFTDPNDMYPNNIFLKVEGVTDDYDALLYSLYEYLKDPIIIDKQAIPLSPKQLSKYRANSSKDLADMIERNIKEVNFYDTRTTQRIIDEIKNIYVMDPGSTPNIRDICHIVAAICILLEKFISGSLNQGKLALIIFGDIASPVLKAASILISVLNIDIFVFDPEKKIEDDFGATKIVLPKSSNQFKEYPTVNIGYNNATSVAYEAEKEFSNMMSDIAYTSNQYKKVTPHTLQVTIDQVFDLWNVECKFRESFSTENNVADIPVIFAKVSGTLENKDRFFSGMKTLLTENNYFCHLNNNANINDIYYPVTYYINLCEPWQEFKHQVENEFRIYKKEVLELVLNAIETTAYTLSRIMIAEKLEAILLSNYKKFKDIICYIAFDFLKSNDQSFLKILQRFDFAGRNPKALYFTYKFDNEFDIRLITEIFLLHFLCFDVVIGVPSGYTLMQNSFHTFPIQVIDLGNYVFDLSPSIIKSYTGKKKKGFFNWLFASNDDGDDDYYDGTERLLY